MDSKQSSGRRAAGSASTKPSSSSRTLRICGIPLHITPEQLRTSLLRLSHGSLQANDLILSLAPFHEAQVATVTFLRGREPAQFSGCRPGHEIYALRLDGVGGNLVVDCDFYGITPLYSAKVPTVDVIAVTGLAGHAFGSWKAPGNHSMWLRDFLPLAVPGARILTFGYDSALKGSTCTNSIQQYSRQLLDHVSGAREKKDAYRPIVFIGHSLGGLVIKQALVDARALRRSAKDQFILQSCTGICFFGVPHKGLNNNNLLSLVEGQQNAHLINDLREGSTLLHRLYRDFLEGFVNHDCAVTSFYETQDTATVVEENGKWSRGGPKIRMVSMDSAMWTSPRDEMCSQIPIDKDHSNIVKFTDPQLDPTYTIVRRIIEAMVADAPAALERRRAAVRGRYAR